MRNLLAEAGIESFVSNETLNSVHFANGDWLVRAAGGPGFLPTSPKLVVRESDADDARVILMAAEKLILHGQPSPEPVALESETGEESWPLCPHCARPRLATCPVCKTSGTDFDAAFLPEDDVSSDDYPSQMVICSTCDEVFAPRYPARCEWCGHRFADGYELPARTPSAAISVQTILAEQLNVKSLAVLAVIACGGIALVAWFAYVLGWAR
jgi:hypothetical protein